MEARVCTANVFYMATGEKTPLIPVQTSLQIRISLKKIRMQKCSKRVASVGFDPTTFGFHHSEVERYHMRYEPNALPTALRSSLISDYDRLYR